MNKTSFSQLVDDYDVFLVDQFGVIVDGAKVYPYANNSLAKLMQKNKQVIVLTNSGKRAVHNEQRLTRLGINRTSFTNVLSSGEVAFHQISELLQSNKIEPDSTVFVISRDNDTSMINDLPLKQTNDSSKASLILIAGSEGDKYPIEHYEKLLTNPAKRNTLCICTNPDITMLTAKGKSYAAGAIANLYEQLGGKVDFIGKPHPLIYKTVSKFLGSPDKSKVVCIGDSLDHDIAGGKTAGFVTALVTATGINADLTDDKLEDLCSEKQLFPDYLIDSIELT